MYPGSFNPELEVYNPRVRPNQHQQEPVEVVVNMILRAVEDIDAEKNLSGKLFSYSFYITVPVSFQTMKFQITFRQQWVDRRLRFNSSCVPGQDSVITIQRFVLC